MMSDKEIKETFELLGIKITTSEDPTISQTRFIDKKPLNVTYQTTTSIRS